MSANPRRKGGPPPPLSPKALAAARKAWLENFRRTRGFPPGFDKKTIEHFRSLKLWYKGLKPPDK